MVLRQPRARSHYMPPLLDDVERVASAKFLGVIFQDNFKMDLYVNSILSQCNQRFYLLKLLRYQGTSAVQLEQIVQAIIVSRIRYALPAWSGFLTVELMNKLQSTLKRLYRFGYTAQIISFNDIAESCSRDLFHSITKSGHCLHELLSYYAERPDSLRPRGHDFVLPVCSKKLHKQFF